VITRTFPTYSLYQATGTAFHLVLNTMSSKKITPEEIVDLIAKTVRNTVFNDWRKISKK